MDDDGRATTPSLPSGSEQTLFRSDLRSRALRRYGVVGAFLFLSSCFAQLLAEDSENAPHFHHVHLNVVDVEASADFYRRVFGGVSVKYAGKTDAIFTERSFILFNKVDTPPPSALTSAIWHIGWGGVDGPNEYEYWKGQGVRFQNPPAALGSNWYMYLYGPDSELIEIYTGERNHRFNHVHLMTGDTNATTQWYADHLGVPLRRREVEPAEVRGNPMWSNALRIDNVSLIVFGLADPENPPSYWPPEATSGTYQPTQGRSIDHLAFSYRDIDPVFASMKEKGAKIVQPIEDLPALDTRSFFVMGPDNVLVEIIESPPIPAAIWE